jgi:hypothetical protein
MPENLYKTKYVSVDNINQNGKRTAFASSADIYNLFQSKENLASTNFHHFVKILIVFC